MDNTWSSASKDILKAITLFPDYPIYFMVDGEEICDPYEFEYTLHTSHRVEIGEITRWNYMFFDNKYDFRVAVENSIWDRELSAGENQKAVDRIIESQQWEPCILVYTEV